MTCTLWRSVLTIIVTLVLSNTVQAKELMKPFILAYKAQAEQNQVVEDVKEKLTAAAFEIVGIYSPYEKATVIVFTNAGMKKAATKSEFGGYGTAQRVSITQVPITQLAGEIQVAYTNPSYMEAVYRMDARSEMAKVKTSLETALGNVQEYGMKKGLTAKKLRKYHYMFGMEYFDEPSELAEYKTYQEAISTLEANLEKGVGGVKQVYRIDIPGKEQSVFGVSLAPHGEENCHSDKFIMNEIDFKPLRSTGHLPYEILVNEGELYALYARFRIAINFPDLAMMGSNSFINIMCAPNSIEYALTLAAGGNP